MAMRGADGVVEKYYELSSSLTIADIKRILRAHGECEYGLRSTLVMRLARIIELQSRNSQVQLELQVQEISSECDRRSGRNNSLDSDGSSHDDETSSALHSGGKKVKSLQSRVLSSNHHSEFPRKQQKLVRLVTSANLALVPATHGLTFIVIYTGLLF